MDNFPSTMEQPTTLPRCSPGENSAGTTTIQEPRQLSQIEVCLSQYDILKRIASNLTSADLFRLISVSKTAWTSINNSEAGYQNINAQAMCDGFGVLVRSKVAHSYWHLTFPNPGLLMPVCGAVDRTVDSRPCVQCHRVVCDNCRIHCTFSLGYRSVDDQELAGRERDSEPQAGPYYIVLNNPFLEAQKSSPDNQTNDPTMLRAHDKGFDPDRNLDIEDIINQNLGLESELVTGHSNIKRFYNRLRSRYVCKNCHETHGEGVKVADLGPKPEYSYCNCTLKKRFLDRWLCLPCHDADMDEDFDYAMRLVSSSVEMASTCACGVQFTASANGPGNRKEICSWCEGEVLEARWRTGDRPQV
jgi:hypothetical protein